MEGTRTARDGAEAVYAHRGESGPLAGAQGRDIIIAEAVRGINTRPEAGVVVIFYTTFAFIKGTSARA
ncbi:hypothetical protein [Thermosediminibacter litoriperuensis]|uniref:Uncharacterized protein n=1 Tax=Thermosediminibacter litoriperuensis TaxID=291989 RepID=A0A5S5AVB0_9FIRM|nr:hypothetical protein [Thermosediminibacter litoriperuensis]TYP56824.1 hypothetical protein LZ11_00887 [Thermosediminibacter litoriperuensis]